MSLPSRRLLLDALLILGLAIIVIAGYRYAQSRHSDAGATIAPDANCNLHRSACSARLPDGRTLSLSITPHPIPVVKPMQLEVRLEGKPGTPLGKVEVDFAGKSMNMGFNRITLTAVDGRLAKGEGNLPVCVTGRMDWIATVLLELDGKRINIPFPFSSDPEAPVPAPASPEDKVAAALPPTLGNGDFTLLSASGPVSLKDYRGKAVWLLFGYTYCPDICPTSLAAAGQLLGSLSPEEQKRLQVIFVSMDPERDTPQRLQEYTHFFHPSILGITGTPEQIAQIAKVYGVVYVRQPADQHGNYAVDHTTTSFLIGPDGVIVDKVGHPPVPAEVATKVRKIPLPPTPERKTP
jgi:protein SCO1/2